MFPGKDGIIRAVELRTKNGSLQRPVQFLNPLELSCDITRNSKTGLELNVDAKEFRPNRNAAEIAKIRINDQANVLDNICPMYVK